MKIEKIELKDYKQFKDLTLDLTYPKGHKKEEKPLDKICIIGQSGVGKTNLLNRIKLSKKYIKHLGNNNALYNTNNVVIKYKTENSNKFEVNESFYMIDTKHSEIIEGYIWTRLEAKVANYDDELNEYLLKLSKKLVSIDTYEKDDLKKELEYWESKNFNILKQIIDKINIILIKFNLKLSNINLDDDRDLIIKDLSNGDTILYDFLSTGTKKIISNILNLTSSNPKDSIILIDEPENSFYPDIQRKLTELYMEVGENNQLIMATHSPLIASSFEPWEVVELKFDGDNQVYRELYYEGDRHIDNYFLDPRMLTWTSILVDIFDLKEDSFSLREKKLMEYAILKSEIKAMENGVDRDEKIKKFKKLSLLLGLQN